MTHLRVTSSFILHLNKFELKQLITTSYKPSTVANTQLQLFGDDQTLTKVKGLSKITTNKFTVSELNDINQNSEFNLTDIAQQLTDNKNNE